MSPARDRRASGHRLSSQQGGGAAARRTIVTTGPVRPSDIAELARLGERDLNFTPIGFEHAAAEPGWRVDRRSCRLAEERPGPPQAGGPFLRARQALINFEVADPAIVRAVFDAATPLEGRTMLLVGVFLWLRFPMGVRVGTVSDGPEEDGGRPVHRYGWVYRTLEGHLERGEMRYQLTKWLDDGCVEFGLASYSQNAPVPNPVVRAGAALFARRKQLQFYDGVLQRLRAVAGHPAQPS